jgi:Fe-S-cluster containining protein
LGIIKHEGYDYAFDTDACKLCESKCCVGESGYIWVNREEILAFADFLNIKAEEFILKYLRKINFRYTLKEIKHKSGFACVFFDSEKRGCGVYDIRPSQCRSFPFWEYFKTHKKDLEDECIGILPL